MDEEREAMMRELKSRKEQFEPKPVANRIVAEMAERTQKFRDEMQEKIQHHHEMAEFYTNELKVIDRFLGTNFFERDMCKAVEDEPTPRGNSRDTREPWERG